MESPRTPGAGITGADWLLGGTGSIPQLGPKPQARSLPDGGCIAAAKHRFGTVIRCLAAGGLCESRIGKMVQTWLAEEDCEPPAAGATGADIAYQVASFAARLGVPDRRIVAVLAHMAASGFGTPNDGEEIAAIVRVSIAEANR